MGFPLFGWYPNGIKLRIMSWATANRPHLVGHTEVPAVHWMTPWGMERELREIGFQEVWDRWALRLDDEDTGLRKHFIALAKRYRGVRFLGDVFQTGLGFAARK